MIKKAAALAHPNIAFIKYWGVKDLENHVPANDSLSMNIGCLWTRTTVAFDPILVQDTFKLNQKVISGKSFARVSRFLDRIRQMAGKSLFCRIESKNNFPTGAGIASSASGFAALTLAATTALGMSLTSQESSALARFGSGSACRSIPGGFVEWHTDQHTDESYAESIAPPEHWKLIDCIAILSQQHKPISSESGMRLADTSPFQEARVLDAKHRLDICRSAIIHKDFEALANITELDSNMMHAVMMTSNPPLFYWHPQSLAIMKAVKTWRGQGLPVTYTLDAGPNVHVICLPDALGEVLLQLKKFPDVIDVLKGGPAGPAKLIHDEDKSTLMRV